MPGWPIPSSRHHSVGWSPRGGTGSPAPCGPVSGTPTRTSERGFRKGARGLAPSLRTGAHARGRSGGALDGAERLLASAENVDGAAPSRGGAPSAFVGRRPGLDDLFQGSVIVGGEAAGDGGADVVVVPDGCGEGQD